MGEPVQQRRRHLRVVEDWGDPALLPAFRSILEGSDGRSDLAANALRILVERADQPEKALLDAFDDDNSSVRLAAAMLPMDMLRGPTHRGPVAITSGNMNAFAGKTLERIPKEPLETARAATIRALCSLHVDRPFPADEIALQQRREDALRVLEPYCDQGTDPGVARAAIGCLSVIGDEEAADLLDRLASQHQDQAVRDYAARRLQEIRPRGVGQR